MFEKEAKVRAKDYTNDKKRQIAYECGFLDGADKANEWHFVKDGDLPKDEGAVLIYWKSGDMKCASVVEPYKVTEDTHIIAWKEIVLPELKEFFYDKESKKETSCN